MSQPGIRCAVMRGGTSKGLYFHRSDLPTERTARDAVLLSVMGSPDPRQIDGMGGAHPLTSKVAVVSRSTDPRADVDYLFLQVDVDRAHVDDGQNCGNLLAGVGPFAIEEGLVAAGPQTTDVRVRMLNSDSFAVATIQTPGGRVRYDGPARIDGAPGTAAPIALEFLDVAGSACGALLPTGRVRDEIDGLAITAIDNGMPVVLLNAADLGLTGSETPHALEANAALGVRLAAVRLRAGRLMGLGDVTSKTVPKLCLVAPPTNGGTITTRTFIPHRVHEAIGVLGAVSVATACMLPGSVADAVARPGSPLVIEHPTGALTVMVETAMQDGRLQVVRAALLRTARLLMRGEVFAHAEAGLRQ